MKRSHCGSLFPVGRKRHVCVRERERDRERQRQRQRDRDRDRETKRQRETETEKGGVSSHLPCLL